MGRADSPSPARDKKDSKKEKRKHKTKDRDREKDRDHDKEEDPYQEYEYKLKDGRGRDKDRTRDKDKDKEKDKESDRWERDKDRDRKDRVRDKDKDRERERERRSHRDYDKDRDRHRDHDKDRDYYREHDRDRDRHRSRRDDEDRGRRRDKRSRSRSPDHDDENKSRKKRAADEHKPSQEDLEKQRKEDEHLALDAEMERRRKRVEEWQRKRLAEQEEQLELLGLLKKEEPQGNNNKGWSLEDDDDDDEIAADEKAAMGQAAAADEVAEAADTEMADVKPEVEVKPEVKEEDEEEVDPLDAFMQAVVQPEVQKPIIEKMEVDIKQEPDAETKEEVKQEVKQEAAAAKPRVARRRKAAYQESSSSSSEAESEQQESEEEDDEEWIKGVTSGKLSKGDKLGQIDHSTMNYAPFRKNFYIEVPELQRMSESEVKAMQKELDDIKVRGKDIPKPLRSWTQAGLSSGILSTLKSFGFSTPLPIQAQALPVIMSGRDCIGIAKTGSGKTLAFVLPMMRHILAQPKLQIGDGPIGLIMAPTRELVQQIGKEVKKFAKPLNMHCICVFGGSGIGNQISELKRGAEIVACTPGRMIDLLVTSNGKITNLRRVTYLVLDEADRMFDMGFEPQIMRIVHNIRPDRQTVMFSATFPRQVEALAKDVLDNPIEILVGGRSVVNKDITQYVEIRPEQERFLRMLELLGEWYEKGKIIIFVGSQDKCDTLFRDLLKSSYPCLSLHGGKDQSDRESTIADFKNNVCNILIATSIAARGLDIKDLVLVVNYDVPNHHEDYVHRVGRTGRAGNKGTAITFIGPDEQRYAPDLVKALKESDVPVPEDLQALANSFHEAKKRGEAQAHGSGYGGSGFKFDSLEEDAARQHRKAKAKEYGLAGSDEESESDGEVGAIKTVKPPDPAEAVQAAVQAAAAAAAAAGAVAGASSNPAIAAGALDKVAQAHQLAAKLAAGAGSAAPIITSTPSAGIVRVMPAAPMVSTLVPPVPAAVNPIVAAAQAAASQLAAKHGVVIPPSAQPATGMAGAARAAALAAAWGGGGSGADQVPTAHYEAELEINDFPQHARWKVTHRDSIGHVQDLTGAAVTTRGTFVPPGKAVPAGERKLYLLIEGTSELSVKRAKQEIKKILEETTEKVMRRDAPAGAGGKYSVM